MVFLKSVSAVAMLVGTLLASGCSLSITKLTDKNFPSDITRCQAFYTALNHRTEAVRDPAGHRIDGLPWLRSTRTLAAKANQLASRIGNGETARLDGWREWLNLSARFAAKKQKLEWQRLTPTSQQQLLAISKQKSLAETQQYCRYVLEADWLSNPTALKTVSKLAQIPDNYSSIKRILGAYPITQWATRLLLPGLKREFLDYFAKDYDEHLPAGEWQYFSSKISSNKTSPLKDSPLFNIIQIFSPIWRIDVPNNDDVPATVYSNNNAINSEVPEVVGEPTEYRYLSETWFDGKWRQQINYLLWFPRRTADGRFDLLAGEIDSVVWRVTLNENNQPLVYDSIHSCGCYHLVIPTTLYQQRAKTKHWPEPPLVMPPLASTKPDETLQLTIASGSHYLLGVHSSDGAESIKVLTTRHYDELLQLPVERQIAPTSMFNKHGIVSGSQRPERWLLWPMGILDAGAMRQAGTQAIAFVGRRHFDDWNLLDQILEPVEP